MPKEFPPVATVRSYFYRWRDDGLLAEINRLLVASARLAAGRDVQPTAGVIDSQSVKTSESTSLPGYGARKRIKGPKRQIITDGGYAGPKLRGVLVSLGRWTIQTVKRPDTAKDFEPKPRRWVVERTCTWLGRCRPWAKDWEKSIESAEAWLLSAHIRRVTRRLATDRNRSSRFEADPKDRGALQIKHKKTPPDCGGAFVVIQTSDQSIIGKSAFTESLASP